jgi:hypothetical protein
VQFSSSHLCVAQDVENPPESIAHSSQGRMRRGIWFLLGALGLAVLLYFVIGGRSRHAGGSVSNDSDSVATFDALGRYVLRNFDTAKPIANFLSGIGGFWGVPMWAFYVNRGQGITSFGIANKNQAISKFKTAEKAYQQTAHTGFRTFVRGKRDNGDSFTYEPFRPMSGPDDKWQGSYERDMLVGMAEMEIKETNNVLGLQTNVLYFSPPNNDFPSMVRQTKFTNTDLTSSLSIDVLDGLARLLPNGLGDAVIDQMGRTMEAWMNVYNEDESGAFTMPLYKITQGTGDTTQVVSVNDGYFVLAFIDSPNKTEASDPLPIMVDPVSAFGQDTQFITPVEFFSSSSLSIDAFMQSLQCTRSRTPSSYAGAHLDIAPGASVTITSVYGYAPNLDALQNNIAPLVLEPGFVPQKLKESRDLFSSLTSAVNTSTSSSIFNNYVKQDYLDNLLRGGVPIPLGDPSNPKIYHTFSRIHGDIERDYNWFQIDTTYFSQGPGNFRDVNQNRRMDVLLNPVVGDFNVRNFLALVQADGYNPLTVATSNFIIFDQGLANSVVNDLGILDPDQRAAMLALVTVSFRPGQLFASMASAGIAYTVSKENLLKAVMTAATQVFAGQYAYPSQNGFWADHWTYTLDLVENYVSVFPDREDTMLWDSTPVPFFLSPAVVNPRRIRYSIVQDPDDPTKSIIRNYNPVSFIGDPNFPSARGNALSIMWGSSDYIQDASGSAGAWHPTVNGDTMTVSAVSKLVMLAIIKFSTLDPYGMGLEYEGGKPGWNDAMNGLPGIIGSGMPETYEMLRLVRYLSAALGKYNRGVDVPTEFGDFAITVLGNLRDYFNSTNSTAEFDYWNANNNAREAYVSATNGPFNGAKETLSADWLVSFFTLIDEKTTAGIKKALALNGNLSPTYFYYDCTDYEILPPPKVVPPALPPPTQVAAKSFVQRYLPDFLEGPTRQFKVTTDPSSQLQIYKLTKGSPIYDKELQMFAISASLDSMGQSVGRMKAFSAGWLENQSIWLHMSYKFYLELLRAKLYDQFFLEIKTGLVPFMNNTRYGRSPLEASSFIVSSAFPDPRIHGAGFLARLSGSTAEFLSMWAFMVAGPNPFQLDAQGNLVLQLQPVLPGWMFADDGTLSFTFLGNVEVTYHNPKKLDTWNASPASITVTSRDGTALATILGGIIPNDMSTAENVRSGLIGKIDVHY